MREDTPSSASSCSPSSRGACTGRASCMRPQGDSRHGRQRRAPRRRRMAHRDGDRRCRTRRCPTSRAARRRSTPVTCASRCPSSPGPPVAFQENRFRVRVESANGPVALEDGRISFEMTMPMGDHRYSLVAGADGWQEAEVVLPFCKSGNPRWYATVEGTVAGEPRRALQARPGEACRVASLLAPPARRLLDREGRRRLPAMKRLVPVLLLVLVPLTVVLLARDRRSQRRRHRGRRAHAGPGGVLDVRGGRRSAARLERHATAPRARGGRRAHRAGRRRSVLGLRRRAERNAVLQDSVRGNR